MRSFLTGTKAFSQGTDSPREFLERCIETIHEKDSSIGAFVVTNIPGARMAADASSMRWKSAKPLSLIDGMPIGIKDIFETADMPTQQGSPLFTGWSGQRDSAAAYALREAGAVIVGKTVTTEFASSVPGNTRNPHDLARTPGGSSSGSAAAVSAGMVSAALGSQVIGSTIRPASYCGCFGFKPSEGGINRGGSFDGFSQSCAGFFGATLGETWTVARAISARAGGDPGFPGLSGPPATPPATIPRRIAILQTAGWSATTAQAKRTMLEIEELRGARGRQQSGGGAIPEAIEAMRNVRLQLGAAGIDVIDRTTEPAVAAVETAIEDAFKLSIRINAWEGRWPLNTYARDMDRSGLSAAAQDRLRLGESMTLHEYQALIDDRRRIRALYASLKEHCDLCVTLSAPGPAPLGITSTGDPTFAVPASLLGTPALSLPVLQAEGLPLGLQLIGFNDHDASMFGFAASILALFEKEQSPEGVASCGIP